MIELVIERRHLDLGGGMNVGRVLPTATRRMIGPYIFFDHIGPLDLPPDVDRNIDVRPHPHIGLSTVTYLFAGQAMHRDSLGYEQTIRPREVNWMTAGRGITHSERFEHARMQGDHLHGMQAWIALPTEYEETAPSFSHHSENDLPRWSEGGVQGQLIAGCAYGMTARTATHSPQFYAHLSMTPGATAEVPTIHAERAVYIATGVVELGGYTFNAGQMLVLGAGASRVRAIEQAEVMVLGGEPIGERFMLWNFVSSSKDRLLQAAEDWQAGRMRLPDADNTEFAPMPDLLTSRGSLS
ncbi:pirin family protein [Paucibacter sp. M5-1]|uniref:pirin family protein n=1 Tax=Paucibacter sp. M5-1 TaxID=3015998 RepID=UPI0022B919BD|nr:pirin family protein [Paucibacter sp. M5-1]MCZ7884111.1 pirin family protein [Paucibacter sp. M5-1]